MGSTDLSNLVFDPSVISSLSPSSLRSINTYRDSTYIMRTIPELDTFRTAYRYISICLRHHGLYSAKFGYLSGIHLSLMLNRVFKLVHHSPAKNQTRSVTPATMIRTFFAYYSSFNWAKEVVYDPVAGSTSSRTFREPVFIEAIHKPSTRPNVASSCTRLSAKVITSEFMALSEKIAEGDWAWGLRAKELAAEEFLSGNGTYVKLTIDVWDIQYIGGQRIRDMLGCLESRITWLMVGLGRLEGITGRAWPGRFFSPGETGSEEPQTGYKGCYLIGVSAKDDEISPEKKKILSGKVLAAVREFENNMKTMREFQEGNCWLQFEILPRNQILGMNLILDERNWSRNISREPLPGLAAEQPEPQEIGPLIVPKLQLRSTSAARTASNFLRPAQDIISRIKWDPQLQVTDFLIGYEDRFVGVKETDLDNWKSEQTDEEFIPMHRIVWVRRKGRNEEKVWDRRNKLDLIFGSGKGSRV